MSCPVIHKEPGDVGNLSPQLAGIIEAFEALLPNCEKPLASLDNCRYLQCAVGSVW